MEDIFIARQPIFTDSKHTFGYELLFRSSDYLTKAGIINDEEATSQVIVDGLNLAYRKNKSYKYFINFSAPLLVEGAYEILPKDDVVIEILETVKPDFQVLEACKKLKTKGYMLALDDYVGQEELASFLDLADIIKIDVLNLPFEEVERLAAILKKKNKKILAEKVEDYVVFKFCKDAGFDYFQGFFFSKPELVKGKKLSSSSWNRLNILKELNSSDFNLQRLAEIVKKDVGIVYRLLRYINSSYFSLRQKIDNVQRAITYLGEKKTKQWLMVTLLADFGKTDIKQESVFFAAFRARFLQLIAEHLELTQEEERFFLLGLLSYLDVLLERELKDVLAELPLDKEVYFGLIDTNHPYNAWLELAKEIERGNWSKVSQIAKGKELDIKFCAKLSHEAYDWANSIVESN
ncbi:MAG: HDOD domain-containing protein [Desulfonauticus sp.]|nr:HDOD domain-containing protein [Desulfonauticus sp.]